MGGGSATRRRRPPPLMLPAILIVIVIKICSASKLDNVYITSSYGQFTSRQLVTSSTLRSVEDVSR
jgi:hypothetical protein